MRLKDLSTEGRNRATEDLDTMSTLEMVYSPLGSVVEPTVTACGRVTVTGFTSPASITPAIKPPAIATWAHVRPIRENAFFIFLYLPVLISNPASASCFAHRVAFCIEERRITGQSY